MQELIKEIAELFHTQDYQSIISALLELGLQINEKFPGISLDKVKNEIGIIDLTSEKASTCFNIVSNARGQYLMRLMEDEDESHLERHHNTLYLLRLALMAIQPVEKDEGIDDLPTGQVAICEIAVKTIADRAVELSQANAGVQKLELYKQKKLRSDDEQTVVQKEAIESILADFRTRRHDYFNGNDVAFHDIEEANRKHLKVLEAKKSQAFKIFASVLVSLTVVGLVVGVTQTVIKMAQKKPLVFLFYKQKISPQELAMNLNSAVAAESAPATAGG